MKNLLPGIVAALVILVAVSSYLAISLRKQSEMQQPAAATTTTASAITASTTFTWSFADAGASTSSDAPTTRVTLTLPEFQKSFEVGTYQGSCSPLEPLGNMQLLPGEITAAVCWFAGGGDEIGLFKEGESYVIKAGLLDEGNPDTQGYRGSFNTVLELPAL